MKLTYYGSGPFQKAVHGGLETCIKTYAGDYRYGFNGQEKDNEVSGKGNSYTAEFWQYDSRLGRRWNIDPVVKHHESPYATFANNPIMFIDPNGADTIDVVNSKKQVNRIEADGNDVFRIRNDKNEIIKTKEFSSNTVEFKWNYNHKDQNEKISIDVIQIKGHENAESLFKFLADNTEVEWSYYQTKRGNSKQGFITTSHIANQDFGAPILYAKKLSQENYIILKHIHNHPKNSPRPSGLDPYYPSKESFDTYKPAREWGDILFAHKIIVGQSGRQLEQIIFQIYLPKNKQLINYNDKSIKSDFK